MGELYNPYPKLPKNIRQIGERDQSVRLYVEDYVNTYLKRLQPMGGQDLRVGLLLGNVEIQEGMPYLFIDGAIEMEDVTEDGEKVIFTEQSWKKVYQQLEQIFPKRTVQGWFLCGTNGCQLSPLNYWKQHNEYFKGKYKLMYLNSGLEGEESVFITSEDGFYKLRGHCIYYERNQMMQDYMVLRKDVRRVETGTNDTVIRDFRQRMEDRKVEITRKRSTVGMLGGICSALSILVLAGGVVMFNNYTKMKEMESVIASVLPEGISNWKEQEILENGKMVIEEKEGKVYQTEGVAEEVTTQALVSDLTVGETQTLPPMSAEAQAPVVTPEPSAAAAVTPESSIAAAEAPTPNTEPAPTQAPTPTLSVEAAISSGTYIIGEGETLYGICLKLYHDFSKLDELCELNGLEDQNKIISGQILLLP